MSHLFNKTKSLLLLFVVPVVFSYIEQEKISSVMEPAFSDLSSTIQNKDTLKIKIFNNDTIKSNRNITGFGYNIYRNNTLYIHQPTIPAMRGNAGFANAANAAKAANLVVYKIQNNIIPPSVSIHELDSMDAR